MRAIDRSRPAGGDGATLLELGDWGIRATTWDDLDLVADWRTFLEEPGRYLRAPSWSTPRDPTRLTPPPGLGLRPCWIPRTR